MKNGILLLALLIANILCAQIKVKINDNLVVENAVIKAYEIKKFEIGFDKPKLLKYYGLGEVTFAVSYVNEDDTSYPMFYLTRSGTNAIEAFLEEVNTFFTLYQEGQRQTQFRYSGSVNFLEFLYETEKESVTMRISLYFKDKIGYDTYGDPISLLKPFVLKFDNKQNFENFSKKKEAKLEEEKAKKEQEQKEEESKKEKKKGSAVLRKLLGR